MRQAESQLRKKYCEARYSDGKVEQEFNLPQDPLFCSTLRGIQKSSYLASVNYRVDVLIEKADKQFDLVEAKLKLCPKALGQLLVYREIFSQFKGVDKKHIKLIAVVEEADKVLAEVFRSFSIDVCMVLNGSIVQV